MKNELARREQRCVVCVRNCSRAEKAEGILANKEIEFLAYKTISSETIQSLNDKVKQLQGQIDDFNNGKKRPMLKLSAVTTTYLF